MTGLSLADFWYLFWPSLTASVLAAVLCGALGVFVVLRRVAFVSAALGQVSGLGVALGFLVGSLFGVDPHGETPLYLDPVVLALLLTGALSTVLSVTSRAQRTSPESAVAFSYLVAAALTLVALASPRIVQEAHEVNDLLFGSTVAVRQEHLVELAVVAVLVLTAGAFLFQDLVFVSFDREMARTLGLPVGRMEAGLNLAIGVSVAVATRAVGALPVFGFLVLPAGAALISSERMGRLPWLSAGISAAAALLGFYLSYVQNWPTGPLMVLCTAASWPLAWGERQLSAR
ncbi:MAG: metal ABC transporter permease [Deltaproteobacteria bacterium]|nr:metal ABC transporter permease [Deltaproteobacteria bacterium]